MRVAPAGIVHRRLRADRGDAVRLDDDRAVLDDADVRRPAIRRRPSAIVMMRAPTKATAASGVSRLRGESDLDALRLGLVRLFKVRDRGT